MSTSSVVAPAPTVRDGLVEETDRYAGVKQYSLAQILAVWAAAALPMGILAWIVAPAISDRFSGAGNVPMFKALVLRGFLLPRIKLAFGRRDWVANAVLFAVYHLHVPWMMPATLLVDTFAIAYPARRYQSAWIGIGVHSAQSLVVGTTIFALVL